VSNEQIKDQCHCWIISVASDQDFSIVSEWRKLLWVGLDVIMSSINFKFKSNILIGTRLMRFAHGYPFSEFNESHLRISTIALCSLGRALFIFQIKLHGCIISLLLFPVQHFLYIFHFLKNNSLVSIARYSTD
jgi:hypothetical protein